MSQYVFITAGGSGLGLDMARGFWPMAPPLLSRTLTLPPFNKPAVFILI